MSSSYITLPSLIFLMLFCYGVFLLFIKKDAKFFFENLKEDLKSDSQISALLKNSGLGITPAVWYGALSFLCLFFILMGFFKTFLEKDLGPLLLSLLAAIYFFWFFRPVEYVFGHTKSLFFLFVSLLTKEKRIRLDQGLYSSLVILKNLSIVQRKAPLSGDLILEKLASCAQDELKPYYFTLLSMYRTGKSDKAFSFFASSIGTPVSRAVSSLLSKLDQINPNQLQEQTEALLDGLKEKRITEGFQKAQRRGAITMLLATITIMIAMLDFLVVGVYMDLMKMLAEVW